MDLPELGKQELTVFKHVEKAAPCSVKEVFGHFQSELGLARTTVLTVMERLRKKGYLKRIKSEGTFFYSPIVSSDDVISHKIDHFVDKTLGGSLSPLLSYFSHSKLTSQEINELKQLASTLEASQKDEGKS